ncbi:MAG: KH domain-containing protein [Clostridia bacterium]
MKDLLISIASGLVDEPEKVSVDVDEVNEDGIIVLHLHVAQDDMGRVIGKQGRIAKAIRTVMRATANKNSVKVSVEID